LISKEKTETRNTIDSFLNKYKKILSEEKENFQNRQLFFDGQYLEMLQHETEEIIKLCNDLNSDPHFIQSINLIFSSTNESVDGYKAEHLMISDIIKAYNQVNFNENEKSKFTLAYFFDCLQGKDLAKGISIQRLNQMATNEAFLQNIEKIKTAKFIHTSQEYNDEYLMPSILFRMPHTLFMKAGNSIYRFASIVAKADGTVNEKEKQGLKSILDKTTHPKVKTSGIKANDIPEGDSIEAVMAELDLLIGLEEVKKSIKELANLLKVRKIRTEQGMINIEISLHAVFMGPPGTGKTTIARLLGRLYKHLGYLDKGHLIETDRAGMVAGYVGQTAIKVNDIVNESIGGVLFIDEAYALTPQDGGRDFGSEAVDTLIKRMEDLRNQLVVVVAGYTEPMKLFVESNPGLRSRFNRFFKFDHFLPVQLLQIFESFCKKSDFALTEDAKDKLLETFEMLYEKRDEGFGNARVTRNLFERCIQSQANRIVSIPEITKIILQTIEEQDIPEPKVTLEQVYFTIS
jgi:stage V sporulation protein K